MKLTDIDALRYSFPTQRLSILKRICHVIILRLLMPLCVVMLVFAWGAKSIKVI